MSVETAVMEEGISPPQNPLVAISFQKDANRKQKYLEAEPKALGIAQIGLSVFQLSFVSACLAKDLLPLDADVALFVASLLVMSAGGLTIAARNLHPPTLKACLGMQVVACIASIFNFVFSLVKTHNAYFHCWLKYDPSVCFMGAVSKTIERFFVEMAFIHLVLIAISVTVAVYCGKVVNCCGTPSRMVISMHTAAPEDGGQEVYINTPPK
ncbi:uncharacterized protein V6R79_013330 [Siganus canaliculatus]